MDIKVLEAQTWLNSEYEGKSGYNRVPDSGKTGWDTMYGLTRALQIELGISVPSNNFGSGTISALEKYGNISKDNNNSNINIVKIIQSALFCKGYNPILISGTFGDNTEKAIKDMQKDMGFSNPDGVINPKIFKALLTMDAYKLLKKDKEAVRIIQQWLNNRYVNRKSFYIQPCDGIYSRGTQTALIYAIQYEEGLSDSVANGNFGPTTKDLIPLLKQGNRDSTTQFVHLLQAALCFNNFDVDFDGIFGAGTKQVVANYQKFMMLDADGIVGKQSWASLLVSYGDPERKTIACDTRHEITNEKALVLKENGYKIVGRYLTGTNFKVIRENEIQTILENGLSVFPIFQESATSIDYFNKKRGKQDIGNATLAAKKFGFKNGTTIYFAVDLDALDQQVTDYIIPYFKGIEEGSDQSYKIGIYGPRNICSRVADQGLSTSSFVSNMSNGYSGNLGFAMPENWNYSQIANVVIKASNGETLEIDKNVYKGLEPGTSEIDNSLLNNIPDRVIPELKKNVLKLELISAVNKALSAWQDFKSVRSVEDAVDIVLNNDSYTTLISNKYKIRKSLIQTVFMWECACEGIDDILSDEAVYNFYENKIANEYWENLSPQEQAAIGKPKLKFPEREDSSTGYCQIFAGTAIDAHNYAVTTGLIGAKVYDENNWKDVWTVWKKLKDDSNYNIEMAALTLNRAAYSVNVQGCSYDYIPSQIKSVIARYNGNGDAAKEYGERNYNIYSVFEKYNKSIREG